MPGGLPLSFARVIDATHVFAIPYATGLLADLGADVIKIHPIDRIDVMAGQGPFPENETRPRGWDRIGSINTVNRGKRSIAVDLKTPRGVEIFRRLAERSDIVAESFTPRVMKSFGLDYAALRELRRDIIMLSNTGYGHTGPWRSYGSVATSMEGISGMCWLSGYPGGAPTKVAQSYTDFLTCWNAVYAILLALIQRKRTGEGQWIDLAMYQVGASTIGPALMDFAANGRLGERVGNRDARMAPHGVFPCAGDDRWIAIAAPDDAAWARLARHVGADWAADPRFQALDGRREHEAEIEAGLARWTRGQDGPEMAEQLRSLGLASAVVLDTRDLYLDPHLAERGFFEMVEHDAGTGIGRRAHIGRPWKMSGVDLHIRRPAPPLGADTRSILAELGYAPCSIDEMIERQVVADGLVRTSEIPSLALDQMRRRGWIGPHDPAYRSRQDAACAATGRRQATGCPRPGK